MIVFAAGIPDVIQRNKFAVYRSILVSAETIIRVRKNRFFCRAVDNYIRIIPLRFSPGIVNNSPRLGQFGYLLKFYVICLFQCLPL